MICFVILLCNPKLSYELNLEKEIRREVGLKNVFQKLSSTIFARSVINSEIQQCNLKFKYKGVRVQLDRDPRLL